MEALLSAREGGAGIGCAKQARQGQVPSSR